MVQGATWSHVRPQGLINQNLQFEGCGPNCREKQRIEQLRRERWRKPNSTWTTWTTHERLTRLDTNERRHRLHRNDYLDYLRNLTPNTRTVATVKPLKGSTKTKVVVNDASGANCRENQKIDVFALRSEQPSKDKTSKSLLSLQFAP